MSSFGKRLFKELRPTAILPSGNHDQDISSSDDFDSEVDNERLSFIFNVSIFIKISGQISSKMCLFTVSARRSKIGLFRALIRPLLQKRES